MSVYYRGNIGSIIERTVVDAAGVPRDLTDATSVNIDLRKPDMSCVTRTATVVDATAGVVQYATIAGDLDQSGTWQDQLHVSLAGGEEFHSDVETFIVAEHLCP